MNKLWCLVVLAAASTGAGAQQGTAEERVTVSRPQLTITLPAQIRRFSSDDFEPYRAAYDLSNGSSITLSRRGNRMYAEIDQQGQHEIVGVNAHTFVALDRQLQVRIELAPDGGVSGELLMVVPGPQVAGVAPVITQTLMLALR